MCKNIWGTSMFLKPLSVQLQAAIFHEALIYVDDF